LLTLGESDKQILNCALQDISSVEKNDLLDVFSTLECRVVPNEFNLIAILKEISHKEFIQKPYFIIEQFHVELKEVGMKTLITEENLCKLLKSMKPTSKNILNILSCIETNIDEIKTFGFFKKCVYITYTKLCIYVLGIYINLIIIFGLFKVY